MRIEHMMTKDVATIESGSSLAKAAAVLRDRNVGCVIVVDGGEVAGILTDRQIALAVAEGGLGIEAEVDEIMTSPVTTAKPDEYVFAVVDRMRDAGFARRIPIVDDDGKLVGIVSSSDIAIAAKRLANAVFDEAAHVALSESRVETGGSRFAADAGIEFEGAVKRPAGPVTSAGGT